MTVMTATNGTNVFGLPSRVWIWVALAGIAIGVAYAFSPLTIWFGIAMLALVRWAGTGLSDDERRWVQTLLIAAIAARIVAVAALFVTAGYANAPFASFFGDEEYFIRRSMWLRNVALDVPIHRADLIYAFDEYSYTSYLYVLGFLQVLVGPAPYGAHLFGAALYLLGAVILYRVVRPAYGRVPALLGLALLLFLPSLFAWSVSALKEPLFFLLSALGLSVAVKIVRASSWPKRLAAVFGVVAIAVVLQTVREVGFAMTVAGLFGGVAVALLVKRPRLMVATAALALFVAWAALERPPVQFRAVMAVEAAAQQHWGHVATPGWVYTLLDPRFYDDRGEILTMQPAELLRFLVRALVGYVVVPLPWSIRSTTALAYVPEQTLWYLLALLIVPGVVAGFRRDALVTSLLVTCGSVAALLVALTEGNVGTLVRHRGLALPYFVWLSTAGAGAIVAWITSPHDVKVESHATRG